MSPTLVEKLAAFDPSLPLECAATIPSLWYIDREIYDAERRAVFALNWQVIGRTEQLAEPGQFITGEVAGTPVVAVRDERQLRAFINVCRHRAAAVATEAAGKTSRLRCRYHGWTYDLRGQLRGIPEFDGVADFRREDHGLVPLAADVWGPIVWTRIGRGNQSLAEFLAPMPERMVPLGLEKLRFVARREYELACNWKVYVDNFLDGGYHVNSIHPGLAGALDYSQYRTEIADNTSVQITPLKPPDAVRDPAVGKVRSGGMAYYWWVFPNFMVNVYGGIMDTNLVVPLGPDRCRVIFDFYFSDTEGPTARQFIADSIAVAEQVQQEDIAICEDVQRGLASGAFDTGRFSVRRERAGYHFHVLLARQLCDVTREVVGPGDLSS
jgi:choline monooxygenase